MAQARLAPQVRRLRLASSLLAAVSGFIHVPLAMIFFADREMAAKIFGRQADLVVPGFFLGLGVFQVMWAWITLGSGTTLIGIGIFGFLGSIVLYLVALAAPLPFGVVQQNITPIGGVTKLIEAAYVIVSIRLVVELSG